MEQFDLCSNLQGEEDLGEDLASHGSFGERGKAANERGKQLLCFFALLVVSIFGELREGWCVVKDRDRDGGLFFGHDGSVSVFWLSRVLPFEAERFGVQRYVVADREGFVGETKESESVHAHGGGSFFEVGGQLDRAFEFACCSEGL